MNGSEKQIAYAETLRTDLLNSMGVKEFGLLPLEMFSDEKSDAIRIEHFEALRDFDGYAGHLIDAIKMHAWGLGNRQVGYHDFMKNICGYKRENKQWVK